MTSPKILFPVLCVLIGSLASANAQTGVVRANGVPVPGATVKATSGDKTLVTITDEQGQYKLDGVTDGAWVFEVEMFRFETARKEVPSTGAANLEWNLTLKSLTAPAAPVQAQSRPSGPVSRPAASEGQASPQLARRGPPGATPPGQPGAPRSGQQRGRPGNQQASAPTELTNQIEGQDAGGVSAQPEIPSGVQSESANESFLLNGTLSRGLQQVGGDPGGDFGPGFGRGPGGFGDNPGGQDGNGQGAQTPGFGSGGGPGGGPGGGGFGGGGFGGRGGGGPGGGGFGGPRGPGGNRPGQQGRDPRNRTDFGAMGNRRNRGQQGIHGMVNVVLHNSVFDARPFAVNGQEVAKPSYAQERYSIQIGGPLMIPKLFRFDKTTFNFNYTGNRSDNLRTQIGTVPTLLERAGDFSLSNRIVYDPTTHVPFPGNRIPLGSINSIALGLLNYFPQPNQTGSCSASILSGCSAQNFQFTDVVPNNSQSVGLRLGQSIGSKDRLALNFQYQNRSSVTPQIFGFLDSGSGSGYNVSLNWIHTFAPRVFNMATVTFNRNRNDSLPFFANGANVAATLGILGTSNNPVNFGPPNLSFTNFAGLTDGSESLTRIQSVGANEVFTWMHAKHTMSFGALFQRNQNNVKTDSNGRGSFSFTGLATSGLDSNGQPLAATGNDLADFLLGLPNSDSIRFGDTATYFRTTNYSFFGQDDWRMLPNFSVNFGLRYEYYGVPSELYGREANLDIARYFTAVAQVVPGQVGPYTGDFSAGLVNPDRNNFAPRLGIAWRPWPKGKTVVRAGYGLYYNGAAYNSFARNLSAQPPFANSNSVITSSDAVLTLASGFTVTPPGKTITNTYAVDRFYRVPYAQTWNFSIQQELPHRLVLQLSYLATKGTRLDTLRLPNRAAPGSPLTAEERRQIGNATGFTFESSDADSIYHSARASLIRRFARGASFNLDYVFAKSIDDAATFGGGLAQNDQDIRAERSLSNFDHRHVFNASYVMTSPFGHNSRLLAHRVLTTKLLQDWTLNGGLHAQTGSPFSPKVAGNLSDSAGTGANGTTRPDASGLPITAGTGFFNTAAFMLPLAGQFGDAGRNTIPGPGSVTLNASFGRAFGLGERRNLEFRFDANNILNHVNISSFGTTLNSTNYGLPLGATAMRSMSVTMRFRF
jgi:hypothetical protein